MFIETTNALVFKKGYETLKIEPWGKDSFRVRSTVEPEFSNKVWALTEKIDLGNAKIEKITLSILKN